MARWRLTAPHYLNVPGTTWEYKEVDRSTGRQKRTQFDVPQLLDPDQPADWTNVIGKDVGEIIVCWEGKGDSRDITFKGDPTPDMVPLDDEARAISAKLSSKWKHPVNSLSGTFGDHLLQDFQAELAKAQAAQPVPGPVEGIAELLTAIGGMMKQNQEILAALAAKSQPQAQPARRL